MITILLEPQDFQPTYNEIITVLDSTNNAKPNFQYVIDVNIAGVNKSRIKLSPNPEGFGVADLHKHIESYISSDLDLTDTKTFQLTPNTFVKYDITLFEEYRVELSYTSVSDDGGFTNYTFPSDHYLTIGDKISITNSTVSSYNGIQTVTAVGTSTTVTTSKVWSATAIGDMVLADYSNTLIPSATVFSSNKFANSSVIGWGFFITFDETDYQLDGANKLLLATADNYVVKSDSLAYLNFQNYTTNLVEKIEVTTSDGDTFFINNSYNLAINSHRFLTMSCGVSSINTTTDTVTVVSGSLPIIKPTTKWYTINTVSNTGVITSKVYTFTIDDSCSQYTNFQLLYQDTLGSFVPFNFDLASKKTVRNKKTNYKQNYGSYDSNANTYGYSVQDRGIKRLDTDIIDKITITSNWITESQAAQVIELMNSPDVYHIYDTGTQTVAVSINVTTNSLVEKKRVTDGLINYQLDFEYSFKNTVQRG